MTTSNHSAAATAPTLRPWASVPVWGLHRGEGQLTGEARIAALRAFRDTGCCEAWLVDPSDYGPDDAIELMGPDQEDIDWSGFPEVGDDDSDEDDAEWLAARSSAAAAWVGDLGFEVAWERGTGDGRMTGVIRGDGERVILTNGDPVFECDEGFAEAWEGAPASDYDGYWNAVIGADHSPASAVREFDLAGAKRCCIDEWLGTAESEARAMGADFGDDAGAFHERALDALVAASALYVVWGDGPCDLVDEPQPDLQVYTPWSDRDLVGAEWVGVFCGGDTSYLDREPGVRGYRELREHEIREWRAAYASVTG